MLTGAHTVTFDMTPFSVRTFAVELENRAPAADRGTPVKPVYNTRITTSNKEKSSACINRGISVPSELFGQKLGCAGLDFVFGSCDENNAVICEGQTLAMPAGAKKAVVIAASADGDVEATFKAGKKPHSFTVYDFSENVGCWDQVAAGDKAYIKRQPVAVSYSHTHDECGDRLYKFANFFKFEIPLEGSRSLKLPNDRRIIVAAVTASACADDAEPVLPLYDKVDG